MPPTADEIRAAVAPTVMVPQSALGGRSLWLLIALCFAIIMLVSVQMVPDPLMRHDDFQAVFGDARGYYKKTLLEGRWINYLWLQRPVLFPAWANYALYHLGWAVYLGSLVHMSMGAEEPLWRKLSVAMIVALSAPAMLISLWYNTLLMGVWICAAYGLLSLFLSPRLSLWLLPVFVPLALMSYTTYPLYMLALCLLRADAPRSAVALLRILCMFVASFALGMLIIYSLNFAFHGVFGVEMADWRNPRPAHNLSTALENFVQMGRFLGDASLILAYQSRPIALAAAGLVTIAAISLLRRDKWQVIYLFAGLAMGLGLLFAQAVKSGILMPPRVLGFALVFIAVLLAGFARDLSDRYAKLVLAAPAILFAVFGGLQNHAYAPWQTLTRSMAEQIGVGDKPLYITGTYLGFAEGEQAGIQHARALQLRLAYLTGRDIIPCEIYPDRCDALTTQTIELDPGDWQVSRAPQYLLLQLSQTALRAPLLPNES